MDIAGISEQTQILTEKFSHWTWPMVLTYFQNRQWVYYPNTSKGKAKYVQRANKILGNIFDLNNETHQLQEDFDWHHNPSTDLEWLILLHKFYYLKDLAGAYDYSQDERYVQKWMELVSSWIDQVPDGFIDSQVTGRRLQQWLVSYFSFIPFKRSPTITAVFFARFLLSVDSQTQYLCQHLTPEGNHRTLELYAIFLVAVLFPELRSASFYLAFSSQKMLENIREDLLPDGVHRELSTDYHHTVLKNYLRFVELARLNEIPLPSACETLLKKAIEFSYYAHKPDGFIPAINDGDSNSYLALLQKAYRCYPNRQLQYVLTQGAEGVPPRQRSRGFARSGYYILRSRWDSEPYNEALYLFFDCACLGFGSHGHYDALSFEMAAFGQSLIIDPGRYTYSEHSMDSMNWRHYFKGTAAHNTVMVDSLDQIPYRNERPIDSEPLPSLKQFTTTADFDFIHGQVVSPHYPACHERIIFFLPTEYWLVSDILTSEQMHRYDLYFHLNSPAQGQTQAFSTETGQYVQSPHLLLAQSTVTDTELVIEQGYVSPEYGIKNPAPIIKFSKRQAANAVFHTLLYPYKYDMPRIQVAAVPVYHNGQLCPSYEVTALTIGFQTKRR